MQGDVAVSVVVPVFGDGRALQELVNRTMATLERRGEPWEIILVNDGSPAPTWHCVREIGRHDPRIVGINLSRNFGQHNALLAGIRLARGEAIVTLDDDLQQPPEEIPRLLEALDSHDLVYGRPREATHGIWRDLATLLVKLALRAALGAAVSRDVSAFRAFRGRIARAFADVRGPYVNVDVWLNWVTDNVAARDVVFEQRKYGKSQYSVAGLARHAVNMLTGFSVWPLRLASLIGFACTTVGLVLLCYVLGRYAWQGSSVPGFPFLASMIAIFSGAQLFALGVMGEYLARMYFRIMERPAYVIDAVADQRRDSD
ncbi:MAG: glycosyltransferase [Luteitalea sp.]|nr:glycosyltransferase [Luteitalea sp.]